LYINNTIITLEATSRCACTTYAYAVCLHSVDVESTDWDASQRRMAYCSWLDLPPPSLLIFYRSLTCCQPTSRVSMPAGMVWLVA